MAHSISTPSQKEGLPYFQRLWRLLLAPDTDLGSKLERLFADETAEFDLDYAFLSRIDLESETYRFEVVHDPHGSLEAGNSVPLSVTYCRKTIADPEGTVVVNDALAEGWDGDLAHEKFGLGSYIGTTVEAEENLYGTLCFASTAPRETPFTDEEKTLIEMFSQWITYELNQWTDVEAHDPILADVAEYDVSPSQIDSMMDTLRNRERRAILRILLDDTAESSIDNIVRTIDAKHTESNLYHRHLPKLEHAEYITWNRDSNTISRGPNFWEVKPLVQLLNGHAEFSE